MILESLWQDLADPSWLRRLSLDILSVSRVSKPETPCIHPRPLPFLRFPFIHISSCWADAWKVSPLLKCSSPLAVFAVQSVVIKPCETRRLFVDACKDAAESHVTPAHWQTTCLLRGPPDHVYCMHNTWLAWRACLPHPWPNPFSADVTKEGDSRYRTILGQYLRMKLNGLILLQLQVCVFFLIKRIVKLENI